MSGWTGHWSVNFWSEDRAGNVEDRSKPENTLTIQIDAQPPYVEITEPANEEEIKREDMPFWVKASASDNSMIERVEFDIEPFGERPDLPYKDYSPPYEWLCDVPIRSKSKALMQDIDDPHPTGVVNLMLRAQVYDRSGQDWIHEIWIHITWSGKSWDIKIINNPFIWIQPLKLGVEINHNLDIEISVPDYVDSVKFVATNIFTQRQTTICDSDLNDGCQVSFDIPTGFYTITSYAYTDNEEIASDLIARLLYIAR
jgi:hypothetical protein